MTTCRLFIALAVALLLPACSTSAQAPKPVAPGDVVATVDGVPISLADVDLIAMQESVSNFGSARLVQALYLARRAALTDMVASRLIAREAKARGMSADALERQEIKGKVKGVTDADVEFWYQTNPSAVQGRPLAQVREPIRSLLSEQRTSEARNQLIEALKAKTKVTMTLEPPRQTVATAGHPTKGPNNAPIEIVEFSDFQCPFCQRANPTVDQVLKTYGDRIRFVYRHYPLPNHQNARPAAEAAACAHAQGQFWKYHDQLFSAPDRLTDADLKRQATTVGLDAVKFNTCVDSRATKAAVDQDVKDAAAVGVSATPSFFINGRPLEGAQPFEAFKELIDEELAARK